MAIKITLKNSVVENSVPTTTHLAAVGELAVNANINSLGIYMRASDNTIVKMAGPGSLTTPAASTTVAGISEYATNTETTTGTSTTRSVTPAGLAAVTSAERSTSNSTYLALAGGTLAGVLQATAGSNSAPAIHFGDSDSGIYGGTNTVSLAAGGTQGLSLDSSAEVQIPTKLAINGAGKLSPLNVRGMTDGNLHIRAITDIHSGTGIGIDVLNNANNTVKDLAIRAANTVFKNASSESARLDSSGRLLVGTSTFIRVGASSLPKVQVCGTTENAAVTLSRYSADNSPSRLSLGKARGATVGTMTVVQDNDGLGEIVFCGADGTDLHSKAASIVAEVDGTPGGNDLPGRLVFGTTADGATEPTTRLTITSAGLVNVPDNGKFTAGASSDLSIYHNGNSYIQDTGTGNLVIVSDRVKITNALNTETQANFYENGACELFFDNDRKFRTVTSGAHVESATGDTYLSVFAEEDNSSSDAVLRAYTNNNQASCYLMFGDSDDSHMGGLRYYNNVDKLYVKAGDTQAWSWDGSGNFDNNSDSAKLRLGVNDDLQIYHDGTKNYLKSAASTNTEIWTDTFYVKSVTGSGESIIKGSANGAVELYWDNAKKLETYQYGVTVTGNVQVGTHAYWGDNGEAIFGAGSDLKIKHDGSNSWITNSTGVLVLGSADFQVASVAGDEQMIRAYDDGGVEAYYDGVKRLETLNYGVRVTGQLVMAQDYIKLDDNVELRCGNGDDLKIYHNGTDSVIRANGPNNATYGQLVIKVDVPDSSGSNNEATLKKASSGLVLAFPSGGGIDFSASESGGVSTNGSILDDYEEGTFDVNYKTGAGGGNTLSAASYTTTGGFYTKIGRIVHIQIRLKCTSATTVGGQIVIEGLPFAGHSSNVVGGVYITASEMLGASNDARIIVDGTQLEFLTHAGAVLGSGSGGLSFTGEFMCAGTYIAT